MSIPFSDTTNKDGLIQQIEDECGFNDGDISGDTTLLAKFTGDINIALDTVYAWLFKSGGRWQFDDINHTKYPIITTDLTSGQRDYAFTTDEQGNIVLDIYKVMAMDSDGVFHELEPVDQQTRDSINNPVNTIVDGQDAGGTPLRYDLTGNGIFLDPVPNYTQSGGVKVFINREGSYFATSDTTKKAGFSGLFHYLLVLLPTLKYSRIHSPQKVNDLKESIMELKQELTDHYGNRDRHIKRRLNPAKESNK